MKSSLRKMVITHGIIATLSIVSAADELVDTVIHDSFADTMRSGHPVQPIRLNTPALFRAVYYAVQNNLAQCEPGRSLH